MISAKRICQETDLGTWFGSSSHVQLDEEVIGLGGYGYTLTVLSSDELPIDPEDDEEDEELEESWTLKFAYGR